MVGNLIVGEGNLTHGGGTLVKQIIAHAEADFVSAVFPAMQAEIKAGAIAGDAVGLRRNNVWKHVSPVGLYRNAVALHGLDDGLLTAFLELQIPKTFIYGERTYPATPEDAGADTPWPALLTSHGVNIEIVPDAGHSQMSDNLDGFVEIIAKVAF